MRVSLVDAGVAPTRVQRVVTGNAAHLAELPSAIVAHGHFVVGPSVGSDHAGLGAMVSGACVTRRADEVRDIARVSMA